MPKVYVEDRQLKAGQDIDIFRAIIDGEDVLILKPQRTNGKHTTNSPVISQESELKNE